MNTYHRYLVTAPDGHTAQVVAKRALSAREKAWHILFRGMPFLSYGIDALKIKRLEKVSSVPLVNP